MTFGQEIVINVPPNVRRMAEIIYDCGVKPELELFDSGDISLMRDFFDQGVFKKPALASLVLGVKYGFPATSEAMAFGKGMLPPEVAWTGFGIGRAAFPLLAQSYLYGGHVRIGMEDCVHVAKGKLTSGNGEMVDKARWILEQLGAEIASPGEARGMLGLAA
jgi:uncharacterized protein (DUF849 family)